ncbi:MAG TPA: enoyl-CoA hydratase/isomerase family protein [Alphaproteobacteria bacterium]|jgi:2-oxoglutaroyl-CoA hydrolase|nr:enoyl-CoA hydratase/isomerase family protein [Alphaproteobacteria bacterium]HJM51839.1 enoyl-CoA hydratase/isomerase family protein [Alphaproteobacteria bacterium]|tara:strand:+ start:493 stop:1305 length:813 start_codon:yes stop_codon:yes gene_type:complete
MNKDYAKQRSEILRELDGLRVEVDAERKIGFLILDRPPLNVVSFKGRAQIRAIIEAFDEDDDVGVVVIRGANGVFSSGGDVKRFPEIPKNKMSDLADNIGAPERCSKPVIAAIEKYALGVGFELSLACDFRFATEESLVGLPEVTIGQMPGSGGSVRIVRMIGLTRAKDIVMLGKRLPATEARDAGLITQVVPDAEALDDLIQDYAEKLNALAPLSLRSLKRVLNAAPDTSLKVALEVEGHSYEKLRWTEDYMEGINAFSERRKADYKGR